MTTHQSPEVLARSILDALRTAGTGGMTFNQLLETTDLTPAQARRGISTLREALAEMPGTSAVYSYDPRGHLYRTAYLPEVAEAYEIMRLRGGDCLRPWVTWLGME